MRYNFTMYDFQPNKSLSGKAIKDYSDNRDSRDWNQDWFTKATILLTASFRSDRSEEREESQPFIQSGARRDFSLHHTKAKN
jgi:hypothetical protein